MKLQQKHFTLNPYTVSTLILLVALIATAGVLMAKHNSTDAPPVVKPSAAAIKSKFSFAGSTGWWQGATNNTSMALFRDHECFASIQYKPDTIDASSALKKTQADLVAGGYMSTPGTTVVASLKFEEGQQQYQLHQYTVTGTGNGGQLYGGQEFGYLPLASGHIEVQAYCNTPDELPMTVSALQAIKFDANK
jgi:hypothetical protein